jgi:hypothetical protein
LRKARGRKMPTHSPPAWRTLGQRKPQLSAARSWRPRLCDGP